MRITKTEGPRYQLAIDRFREGHALLFENLALRLAADEVQCSISASWQPESITEQRARTDFMAAESALARLLSSSTELASALEDRELRYELVHDYGTGGILVATLDAGRIDWAEGFPRPARRPRRCS